MAGTARALKRVRPVCEAPLIGRGPELDRLHDAYQDVRGSAGRVVLVSGGPGAGKSRLVHDFLEDLSAPDGPVLMAGRCSEESGRSLDAFVQAALDLFPDPSSVPERLAALLPDTPAAAPQLARFLVGGPSDLSGEVLASAYSNLVCNLAAQSPVVLVIEDLPRAGPETAELFGRLARSIAERPVLLLATYRDEEVAEDSAAQAVIAAAAPRPETVRLAVGPLARTAADELVRAVVRHERTVRLLGRALYQKSDGNPHILLEMLGHLRRSGALREEEGGLALVGDVDQVTLPSAIRDLLGLKLQGLDEEQRQTLEVAAVQGPEFDTSFLAAVMGQRKIHLLKRLAVLERKHRLVHSSGKSAFRFASRGLHHVVYEGIPAARRAHYHSRCAGALRKTLAAGQKLEGGVCYALVRHLLPAGRIAAAGPHLGAAVAHAAAHHHPARAVSFLERLRKALPEQASEVRLDIDLELSALNELLGRPEERRGALERARAEADRLGGPGPRSRAHAAFAAF
ncbi:MAG: AAA family ATPase, partial [Planctomycetota bacterium]